jgi:hypothetical protein
MDGGGGVAYWAHVGGFAFGLAAAGGIKAARIEERYLHPALESKVHSSVVSNEAVERALQLQQDGHVDQALDLLARETQRAPSNLDAALAFWSVAVESGRADEAAPAALRAIQQMLRGGDREHALAMWDELNEKVPVPSVDLPLLLRLAQALADEGQPDAAAAVLRKALLAAGAAPGAALSLKIATLAADVDATVARAAVRLALAQNDLDPDARANAERLVARLASTANGATAPAVNPVEPLKLS